MAASTLWRCKRQTSSVTPKPTGRCRNRVSRSLDAHGRICDTGHRSSLPKGWSCSSFRKEAHFRSARYLMSNSLRNSRALRVQRINADWESAAWHPIVGGTSSEWWLDIVFRVWYTNERSRCRHECFSQDCPRFPRYARGERVGFADAPAVSHHAHDLSGQMHLSHLWDRSIWPLCCLHCAGKSERSSARCATAPKPGQFAGLLQGISSLLPRFSGAEKMPSDQSWSGKANTMKVERRRYPTGGLLPIAAHLRLVGLNERL
jgi:hypothetical protein